MNSVDRTLSLGMSGFDSLHHVSKLVHEEIAISQNLVWIHNTTREKRRDIVVDMIGRRPLDLLAGLIRL